MKIPGMIDSILLAPCGVNCALCAAHLNSKTPCVGCLGDPKKITRKSCVNCAKKNCARGRGYTHCFECELFPCAKLKPLAKTYRERYGVDLIAIGVFAKEHGVEAAIKKQQADYTCSCGGIISMHDGICRACGTDSKKIKTQHG